MGLFSSNEKQPDPAPAPAPLDNPGAESAGSPSPQEVFDAHPPRKGPGRGWPKGKPRGSRKPGLFSGAAPDSGTSEPSGLSSGVQTPSIAAEQIASAIKGLISVVDSRAVAGIRRLAERVTGDKEYAEEMAKSVAMEPLEVETISNLSVIVINKYNLLGTYAPEALLCLALFGWGYRVHSASTELRQLAREISRKKQEAAQTPESRFSTVEPDGLSPSS